jgi:hypothetical protein
MFTAGVSVRGASMAGSLCHGGILLSFTADAFDLLFPCGGDRHYDLDRITADAAGLGSAFVPATGGNIRLGLLLL